MAPPWPGWPADPVWTEDEKVTLDVILGFSVNVFNATRIFNEIHRSSNGGKRTRHTKINILTEQEWRKMVSLWEDARQGNSSGWEAILGDTQTGTNVTRRTRLETQVLQAAVDLGIYDAYNFGPPTQQANTSASRQSGSGAATINARNDTTASIDPIKVPAQTIVAQRNTTSASQRSRRRVSDGDKEYTERTPASRSGHGDGKSGQLVLSTTSAGHSRRSYIVSGGSEVVSNGRDTTDPFIRFPPPRALPARSELSEHVAINSDENASAQGSGRQSAPTKRKSIPSTGGEALAVRNKRPRGQDTRQTALETLGWESGDASDALELQHEDASRRTARDLTSKSRRRAGTPSIRAIGFQPPYVATGMGMATAIEPSQTVQPDTQSTSSDRDSSSDLAPSVVSSPQPGLGDQNSQNLSAASPNRRSDASHGVAQLASGAMQHGRFVPEETHNTKLAKINAELRGHIQAAKDKLDEMERSFASSPFQRDREADDMTSATFDSRLPQWYRSSASWHRSVQQRRAEPQGSIDQQPAQDHASRQSHSPTANLPNRDAATRFQSRASASHVDHWSPPRNIARHSDHRRAESSQSSTHRCFKPIRDTRQPSLPSYVVPRGDRPVPRPDFVNSRPLDTTVGRSIQSGHVSKRRYRRRNRKAGRRSKK